MAEKNGMWVCLVFIVLAASGVFLYIRYHGKFDKPNFKSNVTVSRSGGGDFSSILEAIQAAPAHSLARFIIHVRAGVYNEVVVVPQDKTNIVLVGDGADATKITASRHMPDYATSESATFTVLGDGFMAQDLTIENKATFESGPAVALLCSANHTIFYRCTFSGYHDTLFAKQGMQFYRECDIYGSVDFIFGFAAAVFQRCNLYARVPAYLRVTYTAQGRQSLDQNSAFTFQGCRFTVASEVGPILPTMSAILGRPWFPYSTVMVMESFLDTIISSLGWEEWPSTPVTHETYLEFRNWGPGANTSGRVHWSGFKVIQDSREAMPYTASQLIQGDEWIPKTGVPYDSKFLTTS